MQIEAAYEVVVQSVDNKIYVLGIYETYAEAYDAAVLDAAKELPKETVKSFMINDIYINVAVPLHHEMHPTGG